jgi:hypothetical protein
LIAARASIIKSTNLDTGGVIVTRLLYSKRLSHYMYSHIQYEIILLLKASKFELIDNKGLLFFVNRGLSTLAK